MGDYLFIGKKKGNLRLFQHDTRYSVPMITYRDRAHKGDIGMIKGSFPLYNLAITFNNTKKTIKIADRNGKERDISFRLKGKEEMEDDLYDSAKNSLSDLNKNYPDYNISINEINAGSMESELGEVGVIDSDPINEVTLPGTPELMEKYIGRWNQVPLDEDVSDPFIDYTADKIFNKIPTFLQSAFSIATIKSNLYNQDLNLIEFSNNDTISSSFKYLHKGIAFDDIESEKMQFEIPFQDSQEVTIKRTRNFTIATLNTTTRSKITELYFNQDNNLCMNISITINSRVTAVLFSANMGDEKLVIKREFQLIHPNMLKVTDKISNFTEYPDVAVEKIRYYTNELHSSYGGSLYKNCRNATRKKRKTYKNVTKKNVTKAKRKTYKKRKNKKLIKKSKKSGKKPTNERKVPIK